jgi:hypothetical protein
MSNPTDLQENDFGGDDELYNFYKNLTGIAKQEVDELPNLEIKIKVLNDLSNKELSEIFTGLPEKNKKMLKSLKVRERMLMLKNILKNKKPIPEPVKKITPPLEKREETIEKEIPIVESVKEPIEKEVPIVESVKAVKEIIEEGNVEKEPIQPSIVEEMLENDLEQEIKEVKKHEDKISPQKKLEDLINLYYQTNPYVSSSMSNKELEVRFGTKGIKPLTKIDYDNVIKKLMASNFKTDCQEGSYRLSIQNQYVKPSTGKFEISKIRTEIRGLNVIQSYCKNNDISNIMKEFPTNVVFTEKKIIQIGNNKLFPINFDDFNFRVSLQDEVEPKYQIINFIKNSWKKNKKTFRFINRVTYYHNDYPVKVDMTISKSTDRYGNDIKTYYTTEESGVFNKSEVYEIEIEIDNKKVGPGTTFTSPMKILEYLRKTIKIILSGLQGTNFPISYPEQREVMNSYMTLLHKKDIPQRRINNSDFIGPNTLPLKMINISPIDENTTAPNIRQDYVVTDKADGTRNLMYISNIGKIYLINTNMDVIFTGAKTKNKDTFNSLLDGELITYDKNGNYINLYAAFDIYYFNNFDVRSYTFIMKEGEKDIYKSRYMILANLINILNPISIIDKVIKKYVEPSDKLASPSKRISIPSGRDETAPEKIDIDLFVSPIRIEAKKFYPENLRIGNIFDGCNEILLKERENRFEYNTDGLIFTHAYFGVGSDKIGVAGPLKKVTWVYSFKWKPPQYNTIDFLVTTLKGPNGDDVVKSLFEDGINNQQSTQYNQYKMLELRTTFVPKLHGYINPCQDMLDENFPEYKNYDDKSEKEAKPLQFYPSDSYGDKSPGLCNIMLKKDVSGFNQMFTEEGEVFNDNTIVEFSYKIDGEQGWRWQPLRVRYDKTAELLRGDPQYGNAYHVADDNWNSIHNRITEDMICTGLNIPDVSSDIYYNESSSKKFKTDSMKDFHNLYVKKMLITSVSKPGDTLIDFACGKAGDLQKWIAAKLSFVFGIDKSKSNLENSINGACARYLNLKKQMKYMPSAIFLNGNSGFNIRNGSAMLNDKAISITKALFGSGVKDENKLGRSVVKQYGKHSGGFNISSCQFAIHYFFENPDMLQGFMRNIAECTKLNGYFIGTAYDGKLVFNLLKTKQPGESIQIIDDGKKIWQLVKGYNSDNFMDNSSSIGYKIDVFQESINQLISEYLVNFDYLDRVMENYGFKVIDREEAISLGLPEGSGLFSELYMDMLEEIKKNKFKASDYGSAPNMTSYEKKISFLNRYFVYKKVIEVNAEKVQLELSEYTEMDIERNINDTNAAVKIAKDELKKEKPKVRKLQKKLILVPGTEAVDEEKQQQVITEENKGIKEKRQSVKKTKKPVIILESDDEDK